MLDRILGADCGDALRGKTILDFGCGTGACSIELAQGGAKRVIGLDIRPSVLDAARRSAEAAGVSSICEFVESVDEVVDVIVSIDAFEHFEDPAAILSTMDRLLEDDGVVLLSFGPTWYHPHGGHLFSIFPWSHLVFSETAQIRWRSDFKHDGATRFSEVEGGLNMMTIERFLKLVEKSPFEMGLFRPVPIGPLKWAHSRFSREFTTSLVECTLVKRRS
jgi:SAM-dependent methyltransferase